MHVNQHDIIRRVTRFRQQSLENLIKVDFIDLDLEIWEAPGEPVSFEHAVQQDFQPFRTGQYWGRPWGTAWFRLTGTVPKNWKISGDIRLELYLDLGFMDSQPGFQAEGLVYTPSGEVLKGIHPRNRRVRLSLTAGDKFEYFVEAASNPNIGGEWTYRATGYESKNSRELKNKLYKLEQAELRIFDSEAYQLQQDLDKLIELGNVLEANLSRKSRILYALDKAVDVIDQNPDFSGVRQARAILRPVLESPSHSSAHTLHAVGHAHIDSAWLWPIRETRRKVARTFANALYLIDRNDDFVFSASSAQQYLWLKQDHPNLFEKVKEAVKNGKFVPIGGMWVEPDANLPSGESLTRQLLEGKRFFMEEFGVEPLDVWLPDSFGYGASLPQIVLHSGSKYFLTQKISWNDTNQFPHHSFFWEGIDGSRVFTHFPPADTYNSTISAAELKRAESTFSESGMATMSLLPFGWGNGGGGPTEEMVEAGKRSQNLEGSPRVKFSDPDTFFNAAEAEYPDAPIWKGELHLELHRATSTSQVTLKKGNRRSESLMREVELWATVASVKGSDSYPEELIRALWRDILLLQFHDILPGTSISWVHEEAAELYADIEKRATELIEASLFSLLGRGSKSLSLNSGPKTVDGIGSMQGLTTKPISSGEVSAGEQGATLRGSRITVEVSSTGSITSIFDKEADRELVPKQADANVFQLHVDKPSQWDAWDVDRAHSRSVTTLTEIDSMEVSHDQRGDFLVVRKSFGSSKLVQHLRIGNDSKDLEIDVFLDWQEDEKFLKLNFPLSLHSDYATSEIQYGHVHRPIHQNTSWDFARFETTAHRWLHVSEPDYGIAISNSSSYGSGISRERISDESVVMVRQSIIRSPKFPDPSSDKGKHEFSFILRAGATIADAVAAGYKLNNPLRELSGVGLDTLKPLLEMSEGSAVIEAVKMSFDGERDVIVRIYESVGVRSKASIVINFEHGEVFLVDSMERTKTKLNMEESRLHIELKPFQLITLRIKRQPKVGA